MRTLNRLLVKINVEACDLRHHMDQHGFTYYGVGGTHLRKITRASQIQYVHILVDVLAVETSENEYSAVSQNRHMVSSRRQELTRHGLGLERQRDWGEMLSVQNESHASLGSPRLKNNMSELYELPS